MTVFIIARFQKKDNEKRRGNAGNGQIDSGCEEKRKKEKKKKKREKKKKKKLYQGQKINDFHELKVGDYVVHETHGLGAGSVRLGDGRGDQYPEKCV